MSVSGTGKDSRVNEPCVQARLVLINGSSPTPFVYPPQPSCLPYSYIFSLAPINHIKWWQCTLNVYFRMACDKLWGDGTTWRGAEWGKPNSKRRRRRLNVGDIRCQVPNLLFPGGINTLLLANIKHCIYVCVCVCVRYVSTQKLAVWQCVYIQILSFNFNVKVNLWLLSVCYANPNLADHILYMDRVH